MTSLRKLGLLTGLMAAGAGLVSCGGSGGDPLASFKTQKLAWQACDPSIVPSAFADTLTRLAGRAQCATMRAPLAYANPSRGEVVVALLRVSAEPGGQRQGAILFNPGGPGGDGLLLAPLVADLWSVWANASPAHDSSQLLKQMSQSYDLIGFSPRGTGASTRLYCGSNEQLRFVANPAADRSPENIAAMLFNAKLKADACKKNPLTPFINTDATARDMDLVRHLLGDEKLNYYGASYGTWLGTWYASLFPQRVGRMLLTGVVDLTTGLEETYITQSMGYQRVFDDVIAPYAARHPGLFALGSDAAAIRQLLRDLPLHLQDATAQMLMDVLGNSTKADSAALTLRSAQVLEPMLKTPGVDAQAVSELIAKATFVPQSDLDAQAHELALALKESYFARLSHQTSSVELVAGAAMAYTISCNDAPMRLGLDAWVDLNNRYAARYPLGGGQWTDYPCLYWGGPAVTRPALLDASRADGILMLQTELDPQTPLEGALTSFAALPNASLIQVDGDDYTHGVVVPYGVDCVDRLVAEYFLSGTQPPRQTHCQGKALAADISALARTSASLARMAASADRSTVPVAEPARVQQLRDMIQSLMGAKAAR